MPETLDVEAKRFSPPPDKANIYVVRTSIIAAGRVFRIFLDGEIVGGIGSGTYLLLEVDPGTIQIQVLSQENEDNVTLDTEGGKNYFVKVFAKVGWVNARAGLEGLNQEEGREAVEGTKRAQPLSWVPKQ